jgi:DUF4097 and DUF4098 domain-containing protein YvlB
VPGIKPTEDDNAISIKMEDHMSDLHIKVPFATSLKLNLLKAGQISVDKLQGEVEANAMNGSLKLTHLEGTVVAHCLNGEVMAQVDKLTTNRPMSITTMNGSIKLILPADAKARVKMNALNGTVGSQFEVSSPEKARVTVGPEGLQSHGTHPKSITGAINGGGPLIQLKAVNGNVQILRQK